MLMPEILHFLVVNFQWSTSVHCTAPVAKMAVPNGPPRRQKRVQRDTRPGDLTVCELEAMAQSK